jgi:hypothetical protein
MKLGMSGIGVMYPGKLADLTGIPYAEIDAAMVELEVTQWIKRDRSVVWIRNGLKHDPYINLQNVNHVIPIVRHLAGLPQTKLVGEFCAYYGLDPAWVENGVPKPFHLSSIPDTPPAGIPDSRAEVSEISREVEYERSREVEKEITKKKKRVREAPTYTDDFEQVWRLHPRGSKADAFAAYNEAVPAKLAHPALLCCVEKYVATEINDRFRGHHLERWIRKEFWREYLERGVFPARSDSSNRLRSKAEQTAEYLRNLGVA